MNWRRRPSGLVAPAFEVVGTFRVYDGDDGACLDGWESRNLIVNNGKDLLLQRLFGLATLGGALTALGVGTDSTAAAVGQTKLNPSVVGSVALQAFDGGFPTESTQAAAAQSTFATGTANFAWNEWALFNGTTNGSSTMFDRSVFGTFSKTSAVSIVLSVTISQS